MISALLTFNLKEALLDLTPKYPILIIPFFSCKIPAGFPSPADDYMEGGIDLNKYLIQHPAATFLFRMKGDAMVGIGLFSNNVLIVDRSLEPTNGKIVIAEYNGELLVRRFQKFKGVVNLLSENKRYFPIIDNETQAITIWGVVTTIIHQL